MTLISLGVKLKSSSTISGPKEPAGADCEICRNIPSFQEIDEIQRESFPPLVDRLEACGDQLIGKGGLLRCPLCQSFYVMAYENDTSHFMIATSSLTRIGTMKALREFVTSRFVGWKIAKAWLDELDIDSQIPDLITKLNSTEAPEAAARLAGIYLLREGWDELEPLLRHRDSAARAGALGAVERSLAQTPPAIICAVATLLADEANARAAQDAFIHQNYN